MLQYCKLPAERIWQNCSQSVTREIFKWKFNGTWTSRSSNILWKISPFLLIMPQIRCTAGFIKKQKCDSTCAWEGGEKGKGINLHAKIIFNITITLLLPHHFIFWASNQIRRIYIIRGPGPHFPSELSLLAACQDKHVLGIWQGKEPRLQVHGIFLFVCDLLVSFLKLLLERFSGIYLLQASGQGLQEKLCSAGFGVREACCLIWVPLLCVRDLLFVCCQDASGH